MIEDSWVDKCWESKEAIPNYVTWWWKESRAAFPTGLPSGEKKALYVFSLIKKEIKE